MRTSVRIEILLIGILLAGVGLFCFGRARELRYDFHHFYRDAHYVWEHGALNPTLHADDKLSERQLPFYLPIVPLALSPLTAGGLEATAVLWALLQMTSLGYSIFELRRHWAGSAVVFWAALLLALPAIYEAAFFNQLSFPILALCLATIRFVQSNRFIAGAVTLGIACITKFLPGALIAWIILQHRRGAIRLVALTAAFSLVVAFVPCWFAFGIDQTNRYLIEWWDYNVGASRSVDLLNPEIDAHFLGHTNQSIRAVVARWMWAEHPYRMPVQPITCDKRIADSVATLMTITLFCMWVWMTRRAQRWEASTSSETSQRAAAAVWMIGMLVFSPLMRQYYLVWAWPAALLLANVALRPKQHDSRVCAWIGLTSWLIGMALWPAPLARLGGAHLVMLIIVAVCTAGAERVAIVRHDQQAAAST